MGSKDKAARLAQKTYWEEKLEQRISLLKEQGIESDKIKKDSAVKKIRAELRDVKARIKAISAKEEKAAEMAKTKAEKLAAPKKEKKSKKAAEEEAQASKRQQKKQKKKEGKKKE